MTDDQKYLVGYGRDKLQYNIYFIFILLVKISNFFLRVISIWNLKELKLSNYITEEDKS